MLQPLEAATHEICGENYLTSSLVIPMIHCLIQKIAKLTPNNAIAINLKAVILQECQKRLQYAEHVNILATATLLDPRFKKIHFESRIACSKAVQNLKDVLQNTIEHVQLDNPFDFDQSTNTTSKL